MPLRKDSDDALLSSGNVISIYLNKSRPVCDRMILVQFLHSFTSTIYLPSAFISQCFDFIKLYKPWDHHSWWTRVVKISLINQLLRFIQWVTVFNVANQPVTQTQAVQCCFGIINILLSIWVISIWTIFYTGFLKQFSSWGLINIISLRLGWKVS